MNMRLYVGLLLVLLLMVGCVPNPTSVVAYEEIPAEGDANRGADLFNEPTNGTTACIACHIDTNTASPDLSGLSEIAGSRVEGESAREYVFHSITEPARHIVDGYGNAMPNDYDDKLTPQQIADLMAYIMSL